MPPRKRAASAPKAESEQEPLAPETEDGQQDDAATDESPEQEPAADGDEMDAAAAERSDLQSADKPCEECMPNGWPEGAFSVGCTHGTWIRDNA